MYKLLKNLPKVEIQPSKNESAPIFRVGIFLWEPDPSYKYIADPPLECAICGLDNFEKDKRLSALLNPAFGINEKAFSYLMRVWVHSKCFDDCIETDEPEPKPW